MSDPYEGYWAYEGNDWVYCDANGNTLAEGHQIFKNGGETKRGINPSKTCIYWNTFSEPLLTL